MKGARVRTLTALALLAGCAVAVAAPTGTTTAVAPKEVEHLLDSFFKDLMQGVAAEASLPAGKRRSLQSITERFQVGRKGPARYERQRTWASERGRTGPPALTAAISPPALAPSAAPQNVQAFFEDMLGGGWRNLVPSRWANSSFDWGHLGDFGEGAAAAGLREALQAGVPR